MVQSMIDWSSIIDGAVGFEKLAQKYVASEFQFPYGAWKETPQTRDGNKDAYTIIIGYHPYAEPNETWWMEAKYSSSTKKTYLTRFRLDATIVSSVFHKRVSKIIFVTNLDIHSKTISDIRIALQRAIRCQKVYFSTQKVLEYWLLKNQDIYQTFFPGPPPDTDMSKMLFVSEDISIYPYLSNKGFVDPCTHLYRKKTYQAYFKVISGAACEISLSPAQRGIKLEKKKFSLSSGENVMCVPFHLTEKFQAWSISEDGRESQRFDLFRINKNLPVLLKTSLEILQNTEFRLVVHSQEEILSELCSTMKTFRRRNKPQIVIIHGESGVGKSYIVHQFLAQRSMHGEHRYYYNFSEDAAENAKRLLQLAFYMVFPYVDPNDIDSEYLDEISKHMAVTQDLIKLAACQEEPLQLDAKFKEHYNKRGHILPNQCELNARYIFIDNIQNLNAAAWGFLLSLIHESFEKNCPFFFLLIGQTYVLESDTCRTLDQRYPVAKYECCLDNADVIENIRLITSFDLTNCSEVLRDYFPNLIVLHSFLCFIQENDKSELRDLNDFLTLYIAFMNGNMSETLVLAQFANIMSNEAMKNLCYSVYTAPNGIAVEGYDKTTVSAMLTSGLVKFDSQNRMVPFHDIYEGIFRRAYQISKRELGLAYADELDETRDTVFFPTSKEDMLFAAKRITKLRKSGHFYSVCYILNGYFEQAHLAGKLKRSPHSDIYYQMYFDYAYSVVNCSHTQIGYDYFEKLYAEIRNKTSVPMRLLKLDLLSELVNSNYNVFRYKEAMNYYRQFQSATGILIRTGRLSPCREENEMYVLCENMRILIQSSRGKKRSEKMFLRWRTVLEKGPYQYYYIDLHVRYAHTLYTVAPRRALQYTQQAKDCLADYVCESKKLSYLVQFQYLYLQLLLNRDYSLLPALEEITDACKKDYYSSFRHRNMALCAVLYAVGDTQKADERFLMDMAHPRYLRNKLRGFYFETLALHYLVHENTDEAAGALAQAAEIFRDVPSYLRTVLHNQKVLQFSRFSPKRIDYNLGGALKRDWYYIDPRAD